MSIKAILGELESATRMLEAFSDKRPGKSPNDVAGRRCTRGAPAISPKAVTPVVSAKARRQTFEPTSTRRSGGARGRGQDEERFKHDRRRGTRSPWSVTMNGARFNIRRRSVHRDEPYLL
jgi:hypothetical protein